MFNPRITLAFCSGFLAAGGAPGLVAAEGDTSKLPAPAAVQVDFARDIKPIFQASCIRCHGPEKPKSGFRLDNRAAALKGGNKGVDIVPGKSAESPLIQYVARLVPDQEMPPEGKGEPLTQPQVALLRAWIDQGATWEGVSATNVLDASISPTVGWTSVSGDKQKFREHYWRRYGIDGGLEEFSIFEQRDPDTRVSVDGHTLLDDYRLRLGIDRNDLGFVHSGWEQYRKYYDDTGGLNPASGQPPLSLGRDLYLDLGKAWVDFGLTSPRWPRITLGYEYDYKRGEEAITSWGADAVGVSARNLAPASKHLDEGTHVIKFDLETEFKGITLQDQFRGEFYKLNSSYTNEAARQSILQKVNSSDTYFQGANSIRLEKKFKDWLFGSGGYFFSKLDADDSFTDDTTRNNTLYQAAVPHIALTRESHIFNLNGLLGPFDALTASVGVQTEWTRQEGFGDGQLNGIAYVQPPNPNLAINPATLSANYDQNTVSETAGLRYSKIPFTTLFADGRFQQESIGQSVSDLQPGSSFLDHTSSTSSRSDLRAGFSTSPWRSVALNAHYRRYEDDSHYRTNEITQPLGGYPGFLSWRDLLTDEVETKLVLHPATWLKTDLSYQWVTTKYRQDTRPAFNPISGAILSPGGDILAGEYASHIYSLGMTLSPARRFIFSGTFSYQQTKTTTAGGGLVPPYLGGVYSTLVSGTYILNNSTDLLLNYSFSLGDYSQSNSQINPNSPPPLGIRYQQHGLQAAIAHRLSKDLSIRLQYGFYLYDEPTVAGVNDYRAQSVFATLRYRFR